jgi:hypothetical protein
VVAQPSHSRVDEALQRALRFIVAGRRPVTK